MDLGPLLSKVAEPLRLDRGASAALKAPTQTRPKNVFVKHRVGINIFHDVCLKMLIVYSKMK